MLQKIRDKSKGVLAAFVLVILCIPFAFFGINNYFSNAADTSVAIVNGEKISSNTYTQRFADYRRNFAAQLGPNFDPTYFDSEIIQRQFLDGLIGQEILFQNAVEVGLEVSPESLVEQIQSIEAFKIDGQFSPEVYLQLLSAQGLTPQAFEDDLRKQQLIQSMDAVMRNSAVATSSEVRNLQRLQNQTRSFEYLEVGAGEYLENIEVSDEEVQSYYDENLDRFQNPEQVTIDYIDLDAANLATDVQVDDSTLQARYDQQKERFVLPERRLASHILIEVDGAADDSEQAKADALTQANELLTRIQGGEDFAEVAKENSRDIGSAAGGGDLGWVERGDMVDAFEQRLFEMAAGDISEPVETQFGYHLIQLREVEESRGKTFEETKDELALEYKDIESERIFLDMQERLASLTFEDESGLLSASEATGMEVQSVGPFPRTGGEGVAAERAVIEAAFSDDILLQGLNSDPISLGSNRVVFIRVSDHQETSAKPLEEVRDQIIETVKVDKARELAKEQADAWMASINDGQSIEDLATEIERELKKVEKVTRTAAGQDLALVREIFKMPKPASAETGSLYVVPMTDNRYALARLTEVSNPPQEDISEALQQSLSVRISRNTSNQESTGVTEALRDDADIQVFTDRLTIF